MNLQRCASGHFYDAEKYAACPYCNGGAAEAAGNLTQPDSGIATVAESYDDKMPGGGVNTVLETIPGMQTTEPDENIVKELQKEAKTISYFGNAIGKEPVVGWLVCIEGQHFGEDFRLKTGRNCIGRTAGMDVMLSGEKSVSREKHTVVVYEPKANRFFIQPGEATELAYLNDEVVLQVMSLKPYDIITLGDVRLMFVPCCAEQFKWDAVKKDNEEKEKDK